MPGQWILRDLYEVVPTTYSSLISGNFAWVQYFAFGAVTKITGIAWYRNRLDGDPPQTLSVWYRDLPVRIWKTADVPDDGTIGWQEVDLSASPLFTSGYFGRYGAGAYSADGGAFAAADQSVTRQDQPPVGIPLQYAQNHSNGGDIQPDTPGTSRIYGLDLRVELANLEPGSVTADVDASLASYLTAAGANFDGNPLSDIKTVVQNSFNDLEDSTNGLAAIKADTQAQLDRWTATVRDQLTTAATDFQTWRTDWTTALATSIGDGMAKLQQLWADILACFADTPGALLCVIHAYLKFLRALTGQPEEAWIVDAETDFTNSLEWPVQADQYRVFIYTFDAHGSSQSVGDHTRYIHFGKWATMDVDVFGEWHYFSMEQSKLEDGGRRMPGLALIMEHGGTGHVQALLRPEAS